MTRLEQLQQFLKDDPSDPFNVYALALEYQKSNQEEAIRLFDELLINHSDYLPTYYTAGKLFASTGEVQKATTIFEHGIAKAREQQQHKTVRELQSALNELLFESE
ncbi:tetratricopeptide repeat protein [Pseudochryseolinea flava]|uniref:Tetratricopeptide repeat protein n=1 Tax=Pseudochryseolinea flava TaxID=2059302 RepID=A0A364XU90_9BACT|nr:tetratricopeptide repeat protein [Pseudochryseolinea flava]RAV97825.1 tetratricopeptide repeat protein [Pseudochryseolinea flava]